MNMWRRVVKIAVSGSRNKITLARDSSKTLSKSESKGSDRLKNSFVGRQARKAADYLKVLGNDYKAVAKDTVSDIRDRPIKASIYLSIIGAFSYATYTNPDYDSFDAKIIHASNDLLELGHIVRNPESDQYIQNVLHWRNEGRLRRWGLVVCSIIWVDNYDKDCALYNAQCTYLKPRWIDFQERIVDVGCFGRWYTTDKKMIDFDVNPNEYKDGVMKETYP
ncbi:mitochondrial import inner membrane translocase subunit Tim29-like [Glandiceps talaboti]